MNIKYPLILRFGKELLIVGPEFIKWWNVSFPSTEELNFRAGKSRRSSKRFKWILDANGSFFDLEFIGYKREWARPIAFLLNLVRERYRVSPARSLTIGDLKSKIKGVDDRFLEAPHGTDLGKLLQHLDESETITEGFLKKYLGPSEGDIA